MSSQGRAAGCLLALAAGAVVSIAMGIFLLNRDSRFSLSLDDGIGLVDPNDPNSYTSDGFLIPKGGPWRLENEAAPENCHSDLGNEPIEAYTRDFTIFVDAANDGETIEVAPDDDPGNRMTLYRVEASADEVTYEGSVGNEAVGVSTPTSDRSSGLPRIQVTFTSSNHVFGNVGGCVDRIAHGSRLERR